MVSRVRDKSAVWSVFDLFCFLIQQTYAFEAFARGIDVNDTGTNVRAGVRPAVKTPSMWKVVFHNDDFTPMEFVTEVLIHLYAKPYGEARDLSIRVHTAQKANVALYTKEVAVSKAMLTMSVATSQGHPLLVTAEEA